MVMDSLVLNNTMGQNQPDTIINLPKKLNLIRETEMQVLQRKKQYPLKFSPYVIIKKNKIDRIKGNLRKSLLLNINDENREEIEFLLKRL